MKNIKNTNQYYDKNILIHIRETLNLTQNELAKKINVSRTCISSIERGQNKLNSKLLNKIYSTFGIDSNSFTDNNGLIFLKQTPIETYLTTNYHLNEQSANLFSKFLTSYISLDLDEQSIEVFSQLIDSYINLNNIEQQYIRETLQQIIKINQYIKDH